MDYTSYFFFFKMS